MNAQDLEQQAREVEVKFNAAFFVNRAGNRIEQLTTYEDYRRDGAVLALMDLGQKRASAKKLTKKGGGQVVLAWVSAPQPIIADDDSFFAHQPAPVVDDAMVERACRNRYPDWDEYGDGGRKVRADDMRADLTAAYDPNCGARTVRVVDAGNWIAADDVRRLTREIDVALNGEAGAAPQASLCDIAAQVKAEASKRGAPLLAAPVVDDEMREVADLLREAADTAERDASRLYGPKRDQLLAQERRYRAALARAQGVQS